MTPPPLLISVAPNGARRSKRDHPAIPLTPHELAEEAVGCLEMGARLLHLHVRDATGRHCLSVREYQEALFAIRAAVSDQLILQITTEACGLYTLDEQIELIQRLRPDAASFALREFLPDPMGERRFADFFGWVDEAEISAQHILYSPEEARQLGALIDRGLLPKSDPAVLFVLGRYADGEASTPIGLFAFVDAWGERGPWSVCAFGASEIGIAAIAVALGGHVRVGFENNLLRPDGSLLASNAEQVGKVALLGQAMGRSIITRDAARTLTR